MLSIYKTVWSQLLSLRYLSVHLYIQTGGSDCYHSMWRQRFTFQILPEYTESLQGRERDVDQLVGYVNNPFLYFLETPETLVYFA